MKARVKATGVIVNVTHAHNITSGGFVMKKIYKDPLGNEYSDSELEFLQEGEYILDYWEKLKHQAAISAMQGILSDPALLDVILANAEKFDLTGPQAVAIDADYYATALVEKLKSESNEKN